MRPERLAEMEKQHAHASSTPGVVGELLTELKRLRAALEGAKVDHVQWDCGEGTQVCPALYVPPRQCIPDCGASDHNSAIDAALRGK